MTLSLFHCRVTSMSSTSVLGTSLHALSSYVSCSISLHTPITPLQAPSKPITALAPTSTSGTFIAGLADGRVVSFDGTDYTYAEGAGHKNLVSSAVTLPNGKVVTAGYDDQLREVEGASFTYVPPPSRNMCLLVVLHTNILRRQAACSTASQPKSLAVATDSTVFAVEVGVVEAIRDNQKVHELKTKYTPSVVAAQGSVVAVGSEVRSML